MQKSYMEGLEISNFSQVNEIKEILKFEYANKMISEGNNFPKINMDKLNLKDICLLLHNKIPLNKISNYFDWSQKELDDRLELLIKENFIIKKGTTFVPNIMIISLDEGKKIYKQTKEIAYKIVKLIEDNLHELKNETYKFKCFRSFKFEEISLFVLSNVILDSIQIDNVETIFLKSKRTRRNGMNYYYSLQEKYSNLNKEALGIYGNMFRYYGNIAFGLYGNKRNGINFHTIDKKGIESYFGSFESNNVNDIKQYLVEEVTRYYNEKNYELNRNFYNGFNILGIMKDNKVNIPLLTKGEFDNLDSIADVIKNDYINIFEENRENMYNTYNNSVYLEEISFEEYFIWCYHIIYSTATDILIERGIIRLPTIGNFNYIVL